ncbi:hypothetical protein BDZ85DRAFT_315081 [Elsinoe ampelina]|uniref:Uncharacterized protein n=1 Tax=Elsinoe ampelina TaxID=302913 RepID=A0A6A6GPF3_9PEZI|nr:hypothetical protein BDZ85DRAFT_315081 [Elsinoe ampelina]
MLLSTLRHVVAVLALLPQAWAQMPIESYQRWLMIIKPNVSAGGKWVGHLSQTEIDAATKAFLTTWPETISNLTSSRLHLETHVLVSPCPLTTVSSSFPGMISPDHLPTDVAAHVSPALWDGVAIYAAFTEHAMWGTSSAADVGWFSVSHSANLSAGSYAMAAWTHESMHTMAWYFGEGRLGKVAPLCSSSRKGEDGTHCGEEIGYKADEGGLWDWMAYHRDYLTGAVRGQKGRTGLGRQAWRLGTRREAYLKLRPGSLMPKGLRRREEGRQEEVGWVPTPWGGEAVVGVVED